MKLFNTGLITDNTGALSPFHFDELVPFDLAHGCEFTVSLNKLLQSESPGDVDSRFSHFLHVRRSRFDFLSSVDESESDGSDGIANEGATITLGSSSLTYSTCLAACSTVFATIFATET